MNFVQDPLNYNNFIRLHGSTKVIANLSPSLTTFSRSVTNIHPDPTRGPGPGPLQPGPPRRFEPSRKLHKLRRNFAIITHKLRNHYAKITLNLKIMQHDSDVQGGVTGDVILKLSNKNSAPSGGFCQYRYVISFTILLILSDKISCL